MLEMQHNTRPPLRCGRERARSCSLLPRMGHGMWSAYGESCGESYGMHGT
jgi:hypothetical protein